MFYVCDFPSEYRGLRMKMNCASLGHQKDKMLKVKSACRVGHCAKNLTSKIHFSRSSLAVSCVHSVLSLHGKVDYADTESWI